MAVTCEEKLGSGALAKADGGNGGSAELTYIIEGTADEQAALDSLTATAPATHKSLARQECSVEPADVETRWTGTAAYSLDPTDGATSFSFDTDGGTQHLSNSIDTYGSASAGLFDPPDFDGAIGVTKDGVAGVDVTVGVFNFEATVAKDAASVTEEYIRGLFTLTGKMNAAPFSVTIEGVTVTFEAGEVLFLGARGNTTKGSGQWSFSYRFAVSLNKREIRVGAITLGDGFVVVKRGWDYLWVHYIDKEDATAKTIVKQPEALYVEQVYEEGDFSVL